MESEVGRPLIWAAVESHLKKYFASVTGRNISMSRRHPNPTGGAYRDRHGRGMGCGRRGNVLRAMGSQGGSKDLSPDFNARRSFTYDNAGQVAARSSRRLALRERLPSAMISLNRITWCEAGIPR